MTDLLSAQRYARRSVEHIVGQQDAEDVLQEAALCAWRHRRQFRKESRYETWFYKVAVRQAIYWLRRKHRLTNNANQNVELTPLVAERIVDAAELQDARIDRLARERALYEAISRLNRRRKLAALRWLAGENARGAEKAARHKAKVELRRMLS